MGKSPISLPRSCGSEGQQRVDRRLMEDDFLQEHDEWPARGRAFGSSRAGTGRLRCRNGVSEAVARLPCSISTFLRSLRSGRFLLDTGPNLERPGILAKPITELFDVGSRATSNETWHRERDYARPASFLRGRLQSCGRSTILGPCHLPCC